MTVRTPDLRLVTSRDLPDDARQGVTPGTVPGAVPVAPYPVDRSAKVYVAGHRGLVGSALWRALQRAGFTHLVGRTSTQLDLRDRAATFAFLEQERPRVVLVAAAKVGGIGANSAAPADFLSDNLRLQLNLLDAAHHVGVERLLFLGSSCIYPRFAAQPITEDALLTGELEPTNDGYAIAKIAGLMHVQALRRQFGRRYISAMPTNLYGPGDNYHPEHSHVAAAMIRRFHVAKVERAESVTCWGSGRPMREFLHADDLAEACLHLLEHYDDDRTVNVGTGQDLTVHDFAHLVAEVVGYEGGIDWDPSGPDGMARKVLDVSRIHALGWRARIGLREGLADAYRWYLANETPASSQG